MEVLTGKPNHDVLDYLLRRRSAKADELVEPGPSDAQVQQVEAVAEQAGLNVPELISPDTATIEAEDLSHFQNISPAIYDVGGNLTEYQWNFTDPVEMTVLGEPQQVGNQTLYKVEFYEDGPQARPQIFNISAEDLAAVQQAMTAANEPIPENWPQAAPVAPAEPEIAGFPGYNTVTAERSSRSTYDITIDGETTTYSMWSGRQGLEDLGLDSGHIDIILGLQAGDAPYTEYYAEGELDVQGFLNPEPVAPVVDPPIAGFPTVDGIVAPDEVEPVLPPEVREFMAEADLDNLEVTKASRSTYTVTDGEHSVDISMWTLKGTLEQLGFSEDAIEEIRQLQEGDPAVENHAALDPVEADPYEILKAQTGGTNFAWDVPGGPEITVPTSIDPPVSVMTEGFQDIVAANGATLRDGSSAPAEPAVQPGTAPGLDQSDVQVAMNTQAPGFGSGLA